MLPELRMQQIIKNRIEIVSSDSILIQFFNCKTGKYQFLKAMLVHSNKPEILRLQSLEDKQRNKFSSNFNVALTELLSSTTNRKLKSSLFLTKLIAAIPDIYYSLATINFCKRRLGEEYTYIAMYKERHYKEQGVLINRKTRVLLSVLQIVSRNLIVPFFSKFLDPNQPAFEANTSNKQSAKQKFSQKFFRLIIKLKEVMIKYLGTAQEIMSNVEWLILMVYMLDWNKHFTFIETLLGIRYVYTYKNDQIREVSYAIQGYLLLVTFIVKAAKNLYSIFMSKKDKSPPTKILKQESVLVKSGEQIKEKTLCRICYDDIKSKSSTKCGHVFCWSCIIKTLEISHECPVCRSSCQAREVIQLRNL